MRRARPRTRSRYRPHSRYRALLRPDGRTQTNINALRDLAAGFARSVLAYVLRRTVSWRLMAQPSPARTRDDARFVRTAPWVRPWSAPGARSPDRRRIVYGPHGVGSGACQSCQSEG